MITYFIRRVLLVPLTFMCITFLVYSIMRVAPGGPIEQAQLQMQQAAMREGGGGSSVTATGDMSITQDGIDQLKRYYKLDRAIPVGYLIWLGLWLDDPEPTAFSVLDRAYWALRDGKVVSLTGREVQALVDDDEPLLEQAFVIQKKKRKKRKKDEPEEPEEPAPAVTAAWVTPGSVKFEITELEFHGVLQGDLGVSYRYSDPVIDTIISKFPISIYFGLIGYFATWIVCIPLGVQKALRHRSMFDTSTSLAVFAGYSIPGFVACLVLMMLFSTELISPAFDLFPLGRFRSEAWDDWWEAGQYWRCIKDQLWHTAIPVTGYLLGGFATMTILMKNSLLENLGADYVRTAFAKGLSENRVVFLHALRNSLIPICVGVGHAIGLLLAGSFLIEKTCNIPGIGLLGFNSIIERDYPVIMGILVLAVSARLLGNILSDVALALVDPRVRFG